MNATGGAAAVPMAETSAEERAWQRAAAAHRTAEFDYFNEQQHKPATVAFALYDNPLGAAAWIVEKFKVWSDSGDNIERAFTKDQLLTNVMIYLVTDTMATAVWFYRGNADDRPASAAREADVPLGFASFPGEMPALNPPRSVLERNFNLVHYTRMPRGGHFACLEQPQLFVDDVRHSSAPCDRDRSSERDRERSGEAAKAKVGRPATAPSASQAGSPPAFQLAQVTEGRATIVRCPP